MVRNIYISMLMVASFYTFPYMGHWLYSGIALETYREIGFMLFVIYLIIENLVMFNRLIKYEDMYGKLKGGTKND